MQRNRSVLAPRAPDARPANRLRRGGAIFPARNSPKIEISSRYDGWWRYNAALLCGCFDAGEERIGFASAESHVADVGANLTAKPADMAGDRSLRLETAACDHLLLYIYIVPHTLPAGNDIADTQPFEITLRIAYGGKVLRSEKRLINQWSGASVEMRVDRQDK